MSQTSGQITPDCLSRLSTPGIPFSLPHIPNHREHRRNDYNHKLINRTKKDHELINYMMAKMLEQMAHFSQQLEKDGAVQGSNAARNLYSSSSHGLKYV